MILFRTVSGRRIDLEKPRPELIDPADIACALAKICRFNGQLRRFYSVAQHSCFVALVVDATLRRAALMHDATEAYLNDVSRHLKYSKYMDGYREIENIWRPFIRERFQIALTPEQEQQVKIADDLAAVWERLTIREELEWEKFGEDEIARCVDEGWVRFDAQTLIAYADRVPKSWTPVHCEAAESMFIRAFLEYFK